MSNAIEYLWCQSDIDLVLLADFGKLVIDERFQFSEVFGQVDVDDELAFRVLYASHCLGLLG